VVPLTPADVKRWDPNAIHGVFQTASNRAATLQRLGDNLQQVHNTLSDWHGDAGDAFRADLGKTRRDIEADGQESKQVAAAVSLAEADVRAVKSELDGIEQTAEGYGFSITPDWRIEAGMGAIGFDKLTLAAEEQLLQGQLDTCKLHAHTADHELANAVRSAVGDAPVSTGAPAPDSKPKSWQDMLLPAGPATAQPGGDPAKGPPVPDGAYKPPSLEDMLLGKGTPAGQKPPEGDPIDLLSRLRPPVVPPQRLNPADIESFKALARQSMIAEGVPPDQIEARLNDAVARTQQWMDAGMPPYVAPPPPRPPAPGFGEAFGDRWNSSITGIQDLVGENGLDAMGDAWGGMAKGLGHKAEEYITLGPAAPMLDAAGEVKRFADNPAYYLGEKAADGALALPGMMFGPEGAGVGELGEVSAAGAIARDLPGVHPPLSPLEQLLPDLHAPLSPLEASGPVDGPAPAGSAGHPWSEPAEVVAPAGHPPPDPPGGPMHSDAPVLAGHAPASEEAPLGAGHAPDSTKVPVAPGHVSNPVEAHAPASHVPSGPPEPPVSGGHGGSGPVEPPTSGGHGSSGPPEPHVSADHTSPGTGDGNGHVPAEHSFPDAHHGVEPYAMDSDGHYLPGSLPSYQQLQGITSTEPNTAFYWSGRNADGIGVGPDDSGIAELIAHGSGGTTLEMTLADKGIDPLPVWNRHDPVSVQFWEDASAAYAENAQGEVTAIIGSNLRPGNVWQTVEIPRLMENPDITRIVQIDPDTGQSTTIFERGK
jgi:uncharacterized protein YukE